jgi:hypothetical protein
MSPLLTHTGCRLMHLLWAPPRSFLHAMSPQHACVCGPGPAQIAFSATHCSWLWTHLLWSPPKSFWHSKPPQHHWVCKPGPEQTSFSAAHWGSNFTHSLSLSKKLLSLQAIATTDIKAPPMRLPAPHVLRASVSGNSMAINTAWAIAFIAAELSILKKSNGYACRLEFVPNVSVSEPQYEHMESASIPSISIST